MNRKFQLLVFLTILILSNVGILFAQSTTASILGVVTDEKGSVIPSATVTARNTETGFSEMLKPMVMGVIIWSIYPWVRMKYQSKPLTSVDTCNPELHLL